MTLYGCCGRCGGRHSLTAGRRNHANQTGGAHYDKQSDYNGNTHGGTPFMQMICNHHSTVLRGRIGQRADRGLTYVQQEELNGGNH